MMRVRTDARMCAAAVYTADVCAEWTQTGGGTFNLANSTLVSGHTALGYARDRRPTHAFSNSQAREKTFKILAIVLATASRCIINETYLELQSPIAALL